jgi:hypothetical protein
MGHGCAGLSERGFLTRSQGCVLLGRGAPIEAATTAAPGVAHLVHLLHNGCLHKTDFLTTGT